MLKCVLAIFVERVDFELVKFGPDFGFVLNLERAVCYPDYPVVAVIISRYGHIVSPIFEEKLVIEVPFEHEIGQTSLVYCHRRSTTNQGWLVLNSCFEQGIKIMF